MSIDRGTIEAIASLAHLRLDEAEVARLTLEMNRILEHVDALHRAEVAGGPGPEARLPSTRPNEGGEPDGLTRPLAEMAPRVTEGFFIVPPPPGVHGNEGEA